MEHGNTFTEPFEKAFSRQFKKNRMRREGLQIKSVLTYPAKSKEKLFNIGYTT